jgi:phosphoribosylaminoimidazole-succinocarboxamide synthase
MAKMLYEGKAKQMFETEDPAVLLCHYKDDATALNGQKRGTIVGKGVVNNRMSNLLFAMLESNGVKTHLIKEVNGRDTLVRRVKIVPLEVIVRNIAAGSLAKRLGLEEGVDMKNTVLEFCYKNDELGDPIVNEYHIRAIDLATDEEVKTITQMALRVNELLQKRLLEAGLILVDFKLEFGKLPDGSIILADEISPDTCRLWDSTTRDKLDKDRFRRDMGGAEEAYQEVYRRLGLEDKND